MFLEHVLSLQQNIKKAPGKPPPPHEVTAVVQLIDTAQFAAVAYIGLSVRC